MTVARPHAVGPLFDMLEIQDEGLHCRYMGFAKVADSLDDRLHAIAVAMGTALSVALVIMAGRQSQEGAEAAAGGQQTGSHGRAAQRGSP